MTDETSPPRPWPEPAEESRPHWEGLAQGRFLLQRCGGCGKIRHYPRQFCDACHATEADWVEASGHATIHIWTVAHHAFHPPFRGSLPYVLITAE
jgi:uncharacterized OB-fold protein